MGARISVRRGAASAAARAAVPAEQLITATTANFCSSFLEYMFDRIRGGCDGETLNKLKAASAEDKSAGRTADNCHYGKFLLWPPIAIGIHVRQRLGVDVMVKLQIS